MQGKQTKNIFPLFYSYFPLFSLFPPLSSLFPAFSPFSPLNSSVFLGHEDIPHVKMFNPNKNKSYDMNFIHKNMSYISL